jgi:mono/diheme cytochrome c family protein
MKKKIIVLFIFACILYSCSPTLTLPASTDPVQQQQLLAGRRLYADHCSSCHNLHFPKEFDAETWGKNLDEMQLKAKITDEEKKLIYDYLTSQR